MRVEKTPAFGARIVINKRGFKNLAENTIDSITSSTVSSSLPCATVVDSTAIPYRLGAKEAAFQYAQGALQNMKLDISDIKQRNSALSKITDKPSNMQTKSSTSSFSEGNVSELCSAKSNDTKGDLYNALGTYNSSLAGSTAVDLSVQMSPISSINIIPDAVMGDLLAATNHEVVRLTSQPYNAKAAGLLSSGYSALGGSLQYSGARINYNKANKIAKNIPD